MDYCSLKEYIERLIEQGLMDKGIELANNKSYPSKLVRELIQQGFLNYPYPVTVGGLGRSKSEYHYLIYLVASAYPSLASIFINQTAFGISPLLRFGTPTQIDDFFPAVLTGEKWLTVAFNEASFDTHNLTMTTVAVPTEQGWEITGKKIAVLNASQMDYFLILADATLTPETFEPGMFIVPKDSPGISMLPSATQIGLASFPIFDVELVNVKVPKESLLGGELAAKNQFPIITEQYTLLASALTLGIAEGAYQLAVEHATQERKFGLKLISHQLIQGELVEIDIKIDSLKALLKQVTKTKGDKRSLLIARISLVSADLAAYISKVLDKFTGSYGALTNINILAFKKDAQMAQLLSGPPQIQRDIILAPLLAKETFEPD